MTAELIHRLHFAFTITFHYLFPQLTMGLALLIVVLKSVALRTGSETVGPRRALLGPHLRHQLRLRRGHRHSHGVRVRHQLGALLAGLRRRHRPAPGHGRRLQLLPRVGLPRPLSLRRKAHLEADALVLRRHGLARLVDLRLLHHRHRRLDAASRRLHAHAQRPL